MARQLGYRGSHCAGMIETSTNNTTGTVTVVVTSDRYGNETHGLELERELAASVSDLDVTLIGSKVMEFWNDDAYYIPALHTKPLCDDNPDAAPALNPLREELQKLAGRPVAFQATANFILYTRDVLFSEAYYTWLEPLEAA